MSPRAPVCPVVGGRGGCGGCGTCGGTIGVSGLVIVGGAEEEPMPHFMAAKMVSEMMAMMTNALPKRIALRFGFAPDKLVVAETCGGDISTGDM